MHRSIYFLLILFCCRPGAEGQTIKNSPLLENLLSDSTEVPGISQENYKYVTPAEWPFNAKPQILLKNKNGLYVFMDGTGRLYKAIREEKGISFQRIDTTVAFDYNQGSFAFSYNDTVYNLGGYGIWRINGQLRKYIEKTKQWDIVKLNEELPLMYGKEDKFLWYDQPGSKIYIGNNRVRNESIKTNDLNENSFVYEVAVLNLTTKDWKKIGNLSHYLKNEISNIDKITSSPWGQLTFNGNKLMLVDYKHNRLLSLNPAVQDNIISSLAPHTGDNAFYFKDSVLFAGNSFSNRLDSFPLSFNDFVAGNEVVFEPFAPSVQLSKDSNPLTWYLIAALIVIAGCAVWIYRLRKTKKLLSNAMEAEGLNIPVPQNGNGVHHVAFEERELEVLRLVYANSLLAQITTLEELNKVMGVSKRSIEIQKKQRSDVISAINRKYNYIHPEVKTVLDKRRSEFDGRSFEYFILHESLDSVERLLNGLVNTKKAE